MFSRTTRSLALAVLASAYAHVVHAEPANLPPALNFTKTLKFEVSAPFEGPSSMKGWVISNGGNHMVVYTTADGQTVVMGDVIDAGGKNWTKEAMATKVPKPDFAKFAAQLEKSAFVATGARGRDVKSVIYAFLDPNCVYCNLAARAFDPYEVAGLQIRWVPVAFLDPVGSAGKAAYFMQSANPAAALKEHERRFAENKRGVEPITPTAETRAKLDANLKLMNQMGITGTPAILFKNAQGTWEMKAGMPRLSELPQITGLPEQPVTDPDLQRFR